ncbi:MAG: hypothetical protein HZA50_19120 [Planctomycetes bacterium]|nr:hypothetical protein [Planctomycetota bacterium]
MISNLLAGCAAGNVDNSAEILTLGRDACGKFERSSITLERNDGTWRFAEVKTEYASNNLTDDDLERISKLGVVESLVLRGDNVKFTPIGLAKLGRLKNLRSLGFSLRSSWKCTDDDIKVLARLMELENLDLGYLELSADLSGLKALPNLKKLKISLSQDGSDSIKGLSELAKVEELDLSYPRDNSEDLIKEVASLKHLRVLKISRLDEKFLAALKELPHLKELTVYKIESKEGVTDLSVLTNLHSFKFEHFWKSKENKIRLPINIRNLNIDGKVMDKIDRAALPMGLEHIEMRAPWNEEPYPELRKFFEALPNLHSLKIDLARDRELEEIAGLKSLRELDVTDACMIKDGGLRHLAGLKELESFKAGRLGFLATSAGMAFLLDNLPNLRCLEMSQKLDSSAWMAKLAELKQLRVLTFVNYRKTPTDDLDKAAEYLKMLGDRLEELSFRGQVTDEMLDAMIQLKKLQRLALFSANFTDENLMKLADLKELRSLELSCTGSFTDKELSELMKALPRLQEVKLTYWKPTN